LRIRAPPRNPRRRAAYAGRRRWRTASGSWTARGSAQRRDQSRQRGSRAAAGAQLPASSGGIGGGRVSGPGSRRQGVGRQRPAALRARSTHRGGRLLAP
jgi:hypothetical protein